MLFDEGAAIAAVPAAAMTSEALTKANER